jgi:hypothetical protein
MFDLNTFFSHKIEYIGIWRRFERLIYCILAHYLFCKKRKKRSKTIAL